MPDAPENLIEFHGPMEIGDPAPYRAVQVIPEWLKDMEPLRTGLDGVPVDTVKRCMPFVDAIGSGYIIPLRRTVRFKMLSPNQLEYESVGDDEVVTTQKRLEYQGSPLESSVIVKFKNSWVVKTPPGYSTLFLPLLNRMGFPFQILAGMVETDTFYQEVYFPSVCLMAPGTEHVLEKGTPLVQLIPIKREAWRAETRGWDMQRRADAEVNHLATPHHYKQEHWTKKEYR
jgi:hypothetical protein